MSGMAASGLQFLIGMDIVIRLVAKVVVPLFFLGMAGSAIVVVISFVEDLKELLGDEE
jgi:hypothetical protein